MDHNDIVIFNFQEGYYNFTLKTLTSFYWITNIYNTEFVIKIDDDTMPNITDSQFDETRCSDKSHRT